VWQADCGAHTFQSGFQFFDARAQNCLGRQLLSARDGFYTPGGCLAADAGQCDARIECGGMRRREPFVKAIINYTQKARYGESEY